MKAPQLAAVDPFWRLLAAAAAPTPRLEQGANTTTNEFAHRMARTREATSSSGVVEIVGRNRQASREPACPFGDPIPRLDGSRLNSGIGVARK